MLRGKATSLRMECGNTFDRAMVFCRLMNSLESIYKDVRKGNFRNVLLEWKARAAMFGKHVTLTHASGVFDGIAVGLADDGGLIVDHQAIRRVFYAGDVTITKQG